MHVLVIVASVSRYAAGVGAGVRGLCQQLGKDCRVSVLSVRDQFTEADRGTWGPLEPQVFNRYGPLQLGYSPGLGKAARRMSCDLVHAHGLWMYTDLVARRVAQRGGVPLLVSPHGMLDPWALRHSAWKKRLAGWLFTDKTLRLAACIHALCESEYRSIRSYGLRNPVCIVPNGVSLPSETSRPPRSADTNRRDKTALFLGRIHAKKGLENLVKAWRTVKSQRHPHNGWRLVIAGNDQLGHQGTLEKMVRDLALERDIVFVGPVQGHNKETALAQADAFVLPSHSEGLPVAVLEAWAHRLPVVMTRQCNIPEGFAAGAAVEIGSDPQSIAEGLLQLFAMDSRERRALGDRGRALVEGRFTWPTVAAAMRNVYRWLLDQGPQPDCVRLD